MEYSGEELIRRHQKVTAKISEFSDRFIHVPGELNEKKTEYLGLTEQFWYSLHDLKVFANGRTKAAQGFVSITLNYPHSLYITADGCCIISVIDASGHPRFTRTFSLNPDSLDVICDRDNTKVKSFKTLHIDKYTSRESLLHDSKELLPNDVLTLKADIYFRYYGSDMEKPSQDVLQVWNESVERNTDYTIKLLLDSPFAKCLSENSIYFERLLNTSMRERDTKVMPIDSFESGPFNAIGYILMDTKVAFSSIKEVFDMYIVANKYHIPAVTDICRCFMKLCLVDHTVYQYRKLGNEYENEGLEELIMNEIINLSKFYEEIEAISDHSSRMKLQVRGRFWGYIHTGEFLFFAGLKQKDAKYTHKPDNFNFYS